MIKDYSKRKHSGIVPYSSTIQTFQSRNLKIQIYEKELHHEKVC